MKIVYRYGLRAPIGHTPTNPTSKEVCKCPVCEQLFLAHSYANTLTEIERGRRAAVRALHAQVGDTGALELAVTEANQACEKAASNIKRLRAQAFSVLAQRGHTEGAAKRGTRVTPPEMARELADARKRKQEATTRLVEHRRKIREDPAMIVGEHEITERAKELQRSARKYAGVYWGTYLLVERAHGASIASLPLYDGAGPNDPRFDRYRGEGSLAVQIQQQTGDPAFTVEQLSGSDSRVQIQKEAGRLHTRLKRDEEGRVVREGPLVEMRRGNCIVARPQAVRETYSMVGDTMLRLRIGSENRAPVWAEWPLKLSKPLPKGAIVSWVTVTKRMTGPREEWSVQFTLDTVDEVVQRDVDEEDARVVAVNFGWRLMGEELRVAYWRSETGRNGDLRLPASMLAIRAEAEEVQSRRDKEFDETRARLCKWLASTEVPTWLRDATKALAQWRSQARLVHLAKGWRVQRFAGDQEAFETLEAWRYHEHHLWQWESSVRATAVRSRDDLYKRWAKILADNFDVLVIAGDFDVRKVAERPEVDEEIQGPAAAATSRQFAAPGRLREILCHAFTKAGSKIAKERGADITRTCQVCGLVEEFDAARSVIRATPCSGCNATWDQDDNACIELLARYDRTCEKSKNTSSDDGARAEPKNETKKAAGSHWDRARQKKVEKLKKVEAARQALENTG